MSKRRVSKSELARELGVSHQAISKGRHRLPAPGADSKYDLKAAVAQWRATSTGNGAENGGGASGAAPEYHRARGVGEVYRAKMARLEYEQMAGELLNRDEVARALFDVARMTRDQLLAMPDRLADQLGAAAGDIVRIEVRRTLKELVDALRRKSLIGGDAASAVE